MSRRAALQDAAPSGAVIVPFRTRPMTDDQTPREWRPMMPPQLFSPEVGPDAIAVYGVLALHVNGQTGECWPSQKTIADQIGIGRESVNRAIKRLEMLGLVFVEHRGHEGKPNLYTLPDQRARVSSQRTPPPLERTPLSSDSTPPPSGAHTGCAPGRHEPYVSEPNDKEPDEGETPLPPSRRTPSRKPDQDLEGFDAFYADYPKHRDREGAARAWSALKPGPDLRVVIMAAVAAQSRSWDWRKEDGRYVPYPATWLNRRRWLDEPGPESPPGPDLNGSHPAKGPSRAEQSRARAAQLRAEGR